VTIRAATSDDLPELERLWRRFEDEVPPPAYVEVDAARELGEVADLVRDGIALVAEADDGVVGFVLARTKSAHAGSRAGEIIDLYVEPAARRDGVARALVHEAASRLAGAGVEHVELDVDASNDGARAVYARWGFHEQHLVLVAPVDGLVARLAPVAGGPTLGVVFVQTDDQGAVERAASSFAPRIGSSGVDVDAPVEGWIGVRDSVGMHDPDALRRLTKELSDRLGSVVVSLGIESGAVVRLVAMERGSILDEYLSVPEFHGPLPPGDVIALAANPTVLHRLTGADPSRVRAVVRTATSPADLPPAVELAASIAAVLGLPPLDR
jgi:ribosomal protein S18 acetylase RimI-like enzyme